MGRISSIRNYRRRCKISYQGDSLDELADNIKKRLDKLAAHIGSYRLDESFADGLKETFKRFNEFAKTGKDLDFHRGDYEYDLEWGSPKPANPSVEWPESMDKNYTLHPLSEEGPYFAAILGSSTLDTNGGPVVNENAQVLDWDNKPIEALWRRKLYCCTKCQCLLGWRRNYWPRYDLWLSGSKTCF